MNPTHKPLPPGKAGIPKSMDGKLSGSATFKLLWDALVDLLGTAATAAIIGRAARRGQGQSPELVGLTFERVDREFGYVVPASFERGQNASGAIRTLLEELRPLLIELTGTVALRRLELVPELRSWAVQTP
jgi:hypothetical protein